MMIEIEPNPNCKRSDLFVFNEIEPARPVFALRLMKNGKEITTNVTGVDTGGRFVQAFAQKVQDSGAAFGYLIYGGAWGIRLRPDRFRHEEWDLSNSNQWGEAYLVYADEPPPH